MAIIGGALPCRLTPIHYAAGTLAGIPSHHRRDRDRSRWFLRNHRRFHATFRRPRPNRPVSSYGASRGDSRNSPRCHPPDCAFRRGRFPKNRLESLEPGDGDSPSCAGLSQFFGLPEPSFRSRSRIQPRSFGPGPNRVIDFFLALLLNANGVLAPPAAPVYVGSLVYLLIYSAVQFLRLLLARPDSTPAA